MNDLLERLGKLNPNIRIGITLGLYVGIAALFFVLMYRPASDNRDRLQSEFQKLDAERRDKREKANNREQFEQELESLNEELARMVRELPLGPEIPSLLDSVSQVGRKLGLDFVEWKALPEITRGFYAEVPVKITVDGSYHDVAMFLDKVGSLDRIVNVRNVDMGEPEGKAGKVVVQTEATIAAFRQLTPEEQRRAAAAASEAAGGESGGKRSTRKAGQ